MTTYRIDLTHGETDIALRVLTRYAQDLRTIAGTARTGTVRGILAGQAADAESILNKMRESRLPKA